MTNIIDRRTSKHKSTVNRRRFLRRFKSQIKKAVADAISNRSITDAERGEKIRIPAKDLREPHFKHGQGGRREIILPGNREFISGDRLKRPPKESGGGQGGKASDQGEGIDDFAFEISREEFLELFFEDLELPFLMRKELAQIPSFEKLHAGFIKHGTPTNINISRSLRNAHGRRIAIQRPLQKKITQLELELQQVQALQPSNPLIVKDLEEQLLKLNKRLTVIPYIDEFDLRYNFRIDKPAYTTKAVMFCLMDVSGSMDEMKKDLGKRFFYLLYLFLTQHYETIVVEFIRHHTTAKLVDEQEFFYSRETGGTVVSSALELMRNTMNEKYASDQWNIYAAQASDGDNWNADSPYCRDILIKDILPKVQYYAYIEIMPRHHQSLWHAYLDVKKHYKKFAMQHISDRTEIYPVFRKLFQKNKTS